MLFVFTTLVLVFSRCYPVVNRLETINTTKQEMGTLAKNKMEEIKSGYIYIDDKRHLFLDLGDSISFKEHNYDINIAVKPLYDYENIRLVNLEVSNEKENTYYNLIRYIDMYSTGLKQ